MLLWPSVLCQHARGEWAGTRSSDEICRDFVSFLHTAIPLHALPGKSSPVSVCLLQIVPCYVSFSYSFARIISILRCYVLNISSELHAMWHGICLIWTRFTTSLLQSVKVVICSMSNFNIKLINCFENICSSMSVFK